MFIEVLMTTYGFLFAYIYPACWVIVCWGNVLLQNIPRLVPNLGLRTKDTTAAPAPVLIRNLSYLLSFNDPEANLTTPDILISRGYPSETHYITTEDGYILTVFRVPHGRLSPPAHGKRAVLIHHGLSLDSSSWMFNTVDKALAYKLADSGYDVWLTNARGTIYSLGHTPGVTYNDSAFWDFSWHEMGKYDIPAVIDHILETKNATSVAFIGFSLGATAFFVTMSTRPEYNGKVSQMFALGPVALNSHTTSPLAQLRLVTYHSQDVFLLLNKGRLVPEQILGVFTQLGATCSPTAVSYAVCQNVLFFLLGFDYPQMNVTMLPFILSHFPSYCLSSKVVLHYLQTSASGRFCQFDYGSVRNVLVYGTVTPPDYDLRLVTVPVYILYAPNDNLADPRDVFITAGMLGNVRSIYRVPWNEFQHLDFVTAIDAPTLVYNHMLVHLKKCTSC